MKDKFVIAIVLFTLVSLVGGVIIASKLSLTPEVAVTQASKAVLNQVTHNWGEIGINDGKVKAIFSIANEGSEVLKLFNVATSCMCTTAILTVAGNSSPEFGMHTTSSYIAEVPPGQEAQLTVTFDPLYHGPNGLGAITREVTFNTNDAAHPELSVLLTAQVTP